MRAALGVMMAVLCIAASLQARVLQKDPLFDNEEALISEAEEQCGRDLSTQTAESCLGRSANITEECKCYWSCFWKKFKFELEDGTINKDLIIEFIGSYANSPGDVISTRIEETVDTCVEKSSVDGCGRVKEILECVGDNYRIPEGSGSPEEVDYGGVS